jgi:hypothetical protein
VNLSVIVNIPVFNSSVSVSSLAMCVFSVSLVYCKRGKRGIGGFKQRQSFIISDSLAKVAEFFE